MRNVKTWQFAVAAIPLLMLLVTGRQTAAGDWPTYRGDNHRSGLQSEDLKLPLKQAWVHKAAHAPRPAWPELPAIHDVWHRVAPLSPTVTYDRAFHVAVVGESLYHGSSADDHVYCVDVSTGKTRWSFQTRMYGCER